MLHPPELEWSLVAGCGLLLLAFVDVVVTTLTMRANGPLSGLVATLTVRLFRAAGRSRATAWLLVGSGPAALVTLFGAWFVLVWAGWSLVFLSAPGSVVDALTGAPADAAEVVYFVGFNIITLGTGDFVAHGAAWQLLSVLASTSGFFVVTLVITYAVSVLSAVVQQRALSSQLHGLGRDVHEWLALARDGGAYRGLDDQMSALAAPMCAVEKQHLAYPVLHVFLNPDPDSTLACSVAVLDDALSVLLHGVPEDQRPAPAAIQPLRRAIDRLLRSLDHGFVRRAQAPPPPVAPGLQVDWQSLADRRRLLRGWVEHQGHAWPGGARA